MKLLSFMNNGRATWGVKTDQGVIDLGTLAGNSFPTLRDFLAERDLGEIDKLVAKNTTYLSVDSLELLPVIPQPEKILCVGLNYHAHRVEANRPETSQPTIFMRVATSQAAHGQSLWRPSAQSIQFDFEGEIAIIIGRSGRHIANADAWTYVAGYAPYNDGSIRDYQSHSSQWTPGKNFDRTGSFGPWMVTRDEIGDGEVLTLVTRLNGEEMQRTTTDLMIFSIPEVISYLSSFCTLNPGDVIVTGTPGGVGFKRSPPVFLKPGDVCEVEVEKVGVLSNTIVEAPGH